MENLNQADRDEITENLDRLNELLAKYNPNISSKMSGIVYFIFCGIAFIAISLVFNELVGTIALCIFAAPYLFGSKANDSSYDENKALAIEALLIMQRCIKIFNYPPSPESTLRYVGYTEKYDESIYENFIKYFPTYKNSNLKQIIKLCK